MVMKAHKPTDETRAEVTALASFGVPQMDIAEYIGISHVSLRKHYGDELKLSSIKANKEVADFLLTMASGRALQKGATYGECARAAMFWAKTRMGWRETSHVDHTSSDGTMSPKDAGDAVLAALKAKHEPSDT
jgi:hypothetical protein